MIKKMSSQDLNDILSDTQDKILTMNNGITTIKNDMQTKLTVLDHEISYLNTSVEQLSNAVPQDGVYILLDNNNEGLYSTYCNNVHPYFKKEPINMFNLKPVNSDAIYFKDEMKVAINGVENDFYKNILKEDTVASKKVFFEEYASSTSIATDTVGTAYIAKDNKITIRVSIDTQKAYGINKFNMIEIDPFLMKSFDIESIKIYDANDVTATKTIDAITNVGKTRIILDQKYLFRKVEFVIVPKYSTIKSGEEIIPFGLKHIYFYEADFRNDSYVELSYTSEEYIDYVNNKVDIYTPTGIITTTLLEQDIKIYLDKVNGILTTELEPSENTRKTISRNIKKIYFKVPIGQVSTTISANSTIFALKFHIENR
jgi:hypothetical protein